MVVLHVFIIKFYPNCFSNYYPQYTVLGHFPLCIEFRRIYIQSHFPEHYPIVREETAMFSFFWYHVSGRYNDFQ